jgi:hypothetical protein
MGTYALLLKLLLTFYTRGLAPLFQSSIQQPKYVYYEIAGVHVFVNFTDIIGQESFSKAISSFKVGIQVSNRSTFPKPEPLVWLSSLRRYTNSESVIPSLRVQYQ